MIVSVEPTEKTKDDESWIWRKDYEDFIGVISIYESQRLSRGQRFIVMNNDTRYIKTGTGTLTYTKIMDEKFITLNTTNSVYTIKLISSIKRTVNKWQQENYLPMETPSSEQTVDGVVRSGIWTRAEREKERASRERPSKKSTRK